MNEDFNRLVELILPTSFRKSKIIELLRELIAAPLQSRFSNFNLFRTESEYESTVTPQVCSLIKAIERRFDCYCEITELNGKPYDFLVSIDRSRDLQAIKEFIEMHKLAGKSFVFELADTAFTAIWINYVDENIIELYAAEWIEHVDEQDGINSLQVTIIPLWEANQFTIRVSAVYPVKSNLAVSVLPFYPEDHPLTQYVLNFVPGDVIKELVIIEPAVPDGSTLNYWCRVYPETDDYYSYIIQ